MSSETTVQFNIQMLKKKIVAIWGTWENYDQECQFFRAMDCENPGDSKTPSYGAIITFMKMSYNFYSFVSGAIDCFRGLSDVIAAIAMVFPNISAIFTSVGTKVIEMIVGGVAQVLSAGAWGILRGAYFLLKMGYALYKVVNEAMEDPIFLTGQVIGLGIRAALTFILGKKKLKLRKIR